MQFNTTSFYLEMDTVREEGQGQPQTEPRPLLVYRRRNKTQQGPKLEGGMYDGDENKRLDALRLAMELGADYVDVQLQVAYEFYDSIRGKTFNKTKVIVSSHNYQLTPSMEDLGNLVARIQATGADIVKIATTALDITDVARMFQIMVHSQVPFIGLVCG
ncbi:hypothetical protein JHK85_023059 [Glycine max]|nr:hypothetical protein JHK85_023059 [Glycine max]